MTPSSAPTAPSTAVCPRHPASPAVATCSRCGGFVCAQDHRLLDGASYCEDCAARPDVDYLEAFRLRYWGKRDGWAWMLGIGGALNLPAAVVLGIGGDWVSAATCVLFAANALCFFLGLAWSRIALLGLNALSLALGVALSGPAGLAAIFPVLISIAILQDTRNKLFFKLEVPREKLQKAWHVYSNNVVARAGLWLGLLGLAVPGLAVVALICSGVGLRRVNPSARPPIGRKGQAIAGLVLGALGTLEWTFILLSAALSR